MNRRVHQAETLLVGSNGFIGRNIQTLLSNLGMSYVKGLRESGNSIIGFELARSNESFLEFPEIQRIIHVGTPSKISETQWKSIMETHVEDVLGFAEVAKNQSKKIYFYWAGSYWQDQERSDEYTNAKRSIEDGLRAISSENFRVVSLHIGDTYGLEDTREKLIPAILNSLKNENILQIEHSENLMSPIHIADIKAAFSTLFHLEKSNYLSEFQVFDLMGMEAVSVQEILEITRSLKNNFQYQKNQQEGDAYVVRPTHANIPGWCPTICLSEGLKELLFRNEVSKF